MTLSPVRALVIEAVDASAELMSRPVVAERWHEPSALEGMTVGALSAHLVRAAGAALAYLDRTDASLTAADIADGDLLTPVTYFTTALEAPIHDQIKDVSAQEAEVGHSDMVQKCRDVASDMRTRFAEEPEGRLVGALGGRMLSLEDFCRTRLIEVLTHLDDLAVSVDEARPATSDEGVAIVVDILTGIARERHGDWMVLNALSRSERLAGTEVFPVF